jgi:hypothetical protein
MAKYKNVSDLEHVIPNIGVAKPGEVIEAEEINNPNFELVVEETKPAPKVEEVAK